MAASSVARGAFPSFKRRIQFLAAAAPAAFMRNASPAFAFPYLLHFSVFTPFQQPASHTCVAAVVALFPALHARVDTDGTTDGERPSIDFRPTFEEPGDFIVFRSCTPFALLFPCARKPFPHPHCFGFPCGDGGGSTSLFLWGSIRTVFRTAVRDSSLSSSG